MSAMRRRRRAAMGPIGRYLEDMRRYALLATLRAEEEAHHFARTGEHQEIDAFFHVRNDERTTALRLAQYEGQLRAARMAGRYGGGTMLRRVLPDGSTEPWASPEPVEAAPEETAPHPAAPEPGPAAPVPEPPAATVTIPVATVPVTAAPMASDAVKAVTPIQRLRETARKLIGRLVA